MYPDSNNLPVSSGTRRHLLHPRLCGLFGSDMVRKHKALDTHQYWVEPSIHPRVKDIIRHMVMPIVGDWTHHAWAEVSTPSEHVFNWVECIPSDYVDYGGIAIPGGDASLRNFESVSQREMPAEIVCNNGLHEALHSLFYAVHSNQGLMCIEETCFDQVLTFESWDWRWRGPVTALEHAVYTMYGHPVLTDGMPKSEVESMLGTVNPKNVGQGSV